MAKDHLAHISRRMAGTTLWLVISMIALNAATWIFPKLSSVEKGYGLSFSLSDRLISSNNLDWNSFPWWQIGGAIVLSSLPLLVLSVGLLNLRSLFKDYSEENYFSSASSFHMEKVGRSVFFWVLFNFFSEPLLSMWITMREPVGQRVLSLSFQASEVVSIFIGMCIILISRILRRAAELNEENKSFV